ncbi:hypothetical protein PVAND_004761 [Polypedilum vanderplanki]|uniref:Uncharacterized protein n=1 Tax=Polypedilum vanderplanki TaxID=319348 RepID=A0A9J6C030_POLVA|nr:hypothetical protein PVAND_004761 [Polypedilum vanderplanki]
MKISAKILYCVLLIIFSANYEIAEAKGGRGGFGGRSSGGSSRGGGWGGSKSSGGWFSRPSSSSHSYSRPSPSYSYSHPSPSYTYSRPSYSAPAPSPSYGWNINTNTNSRGTSIGSNSPSYGWNIGNNANTGSISSNTGSKPNYGWNIGSNTNTGSHIGSSNTGSKTNYGWNFGSNSNAPKPSAPVGPPPSYPGYQNRPVGNSNLPPAYSPSYHNPPAYSPSHYNPPSYSSNNVYRTNSYNTFSSYPGSHYSGMNHGYGQQFGSAGLGGNTYISNNYYGSNNRGGFGGSGFLTNALFYGAGMHHGYSWGRHSDHNYYGNDHYRRREWNEDQDRSWRATTQAPYFANKVPGEDKILPASAVVGAAYAFGLVSLLPLNVPKNNPLMYCSNTDLMQAQIRLENGYTYQCINNTIEVICPKIDNSTNVLNTTVINEENELNSTDASTITISTSLPICENRLMTCSNEESIEEIYCKSGTLYSNENIFCNSTTLLNGTNINETITILNCYKGELPNSQASFIPTTTPFPATTTEKSLSIGAKIHIFLLKLVGKSDVLEKTTIAPEPDIPQLSLNDSWTPEALTIPPETTTESTTTTTTTEGPYKWMMKQTKQLENGTIVTELQDVPEDLLNISKMYNNLTVNLGMEKSEGTTMPPEYVKVYLTKTEANVANSTVNATEVSTTTSTEKYAEMKLNEQDELDYTA